MLWRDRAHEAVFWPAISTPRPDTGTVDTSTSRCERGPFQTFGRPRCSR